MGREFRRLSLHLLATALCAAVLAVGRAASAELTPEQRGRLARAMPKTLSKLEQRAPVHVIVAGDSVSKYFLPGQAKDSEVFIKGYPCEFLRRLADRFYYTGGVRDIKPRRGTPDNLFPSVGPEITVRSFTRNGAVIMQALQWLTTDGFDNAPDLTIINYGINDAFNNMRSVRYTQILDRCIRLCRQAGSEVIVLGCSVVSGDDPRFQIGKTRPYVQAARRVAAARGVAFFDLGDGTFFASRRKPINALTAFTDAVRETELAFFSHKPPVSDKIHPNPAGHKRLGDFLAKSLIDGPPPRTYKLSAFFVFPERDSGRAGVTLRLVNDSAVEKTGVICPLAVGNNWKPSQPDIPFSLAPGAMIDLKLVYEAGTGDPSGGRIDTFRGVVPISFIIIDNEEQRLYDAEAISYPIGLDWPIQGQIEVAGEFSLPVTVRNNMRRNATGRYRAEWNGQVQEGEILVGPNERQALTLRFRVPDTRVLRVKKELNVQVSLGGKKYLFHRVVEASRAFALGQKIPMISRAAYKPGADAAAAGHSGVVASFSATDRVLAVQIDLDGVELDDATDAARVDFTVDARPSQNRNEPGYGGTVTATYNSNDGPAQVRKLVQAAFGEGYNRDLDMAYIKGATAVKAGGGHRFTLEIPRAYFYLHEWRQESNHSNLGVNLVLTLRRLDPKTGQPFYSLEHTFMLVYSGIHRDDTDGLGILELAGRASGRWAIRIY